MKIDEEDILALLSESCQEAGSISAWAQKHGLAVSYVAEVLRGQNRPGPKVLSALRKRKVKQMYEDMDEADA